MTSSIMKHELPEFCLVFNPEGGPGKYVGAVKRGELGYSPTTYDVEDPEKAKELIATINRRLGVTDIQAECMQVGSMFGWHVPGASPSAMEAASSSRELTNPSTKPVQLAESTWRPSSVEQAKSRIESRRRSALDMLNPAQRVALVAFREQHGRTWKSTLRDGWERAAYPGELQQIRNQLGPSWLNRLTPADFEFARGSEQCYGVLKDCSPDSLSFLGSFDGVVVGKPDTDHPNRLTHVKLSMDALHCVLDFPADFVFESVVEDSAREPDLDPQAMSDAALRAEAAYLGWALHMPEGGMTDAQMNNEELKQRHADVAAEALKRTKEVTATHSKMASPEIETPVI